MYFKIIKQKDIINMCCFYIVITSSSLLWFLLSLVASMFIASAIVTPKWLIGPNQIIVNETLRETIYFPSVGIYTRCKQMQHDKHFQCGPFDLEGFATDHFVYPTEWKAAMFFISLGFAILSFTVALTLVTCCRQSACGRSIHNMTACAQVVAGISIILAIFLHPLGWGVRRVQVLCGADAEPFYPSACQIGISFYCAVIGALLVFVSAVISSKAESSNMRRVIKQRVEDGDLLVCIP